MAIWFFETLCVEYSDDLKLTRIWKELDSEPHKVVCIKNMNDTSINIEDLQYCYKYYREAPPDISQSFINTRLPENTKIFCNWEYNGRESFEDLQIRPRTYSDVFAEAFELNGIGKKIKLYLIEKNKILFQFIK